MIINAKIFGAKDRSGNAVMLETLIGDVDVQYDKTLSGIYIDDDELVKRTSLNWFVRMSPRQVLESDTLIGKYLLISNAKYL